jgi:DNA-binding transcriptional MocR family regulator
VEPDEPLEIRGTTAAEIADSVRGLVDRGALAPGQVLPPVRTLAERLGVNRNTAVAAYRTLASSGVVVSRDAAGPASPSTRRRPRRASPAPMTCTIWAPATPTPA